MPHSITFQADSKPKARLIAVLYLRPTAFDLMAAFGKLWCFDIVPCVGASGLPCDFPPGSRATCLSTSTTRRRPAQPLCERAEAGLCCPVVPFFPFLGVIPFKLNQPKKGAIFLMATGHLSWFRSVVEVPFRREREREEPFKFAHAARRAGIRYDRH